jgi:RNA polymerase sigma-70 factor (ECF subfamily)
MNPLDSMMNLFEKKRVPTLRSFEQVALAELPVLYRVAKRLASDPSKAEDLVGQTLLDAGKAWDNFDGEFPRSWLIRILQNNHRKDLRRESSRPKTQPIEDYQETSESDNWGELNWKVIGPNILEEVDRLPEEYRLAVVLCDVEQLDYAEAAEAMEVPIGTVRSRLYRGRRILRDRLVQYVDGVDSIMGGVYA